MTSYYSRDELLGLSFKELGRDVLLSKKASIYYPQKIKIGNNVRIDDFCILSGSITFGNNIHIAAGCYLFAGNAGIIFQDYSCVSSRCAVYAISDDYSGNYLTNATIPVEYRHVNEAEVIIGKHVLVGSGSTVLPGVVITEGCSVGSMSLVNKSTEPWGIYVGIPCKRIKERSRKLIDFEIKYENSLANR